MEEENIVVVVVVVVVDDDDDNDDKSIGYSATRFNNQRTSFPVTGVTSTYVGFC
jgi:hypothetical protein